MVAIRNASAIMPSVTMTGTLEIASLNVFISSSLRALRQFIPAAHVCDSFLVSRDHYFGPLGYSRAILTAGADGFARALLGEYHLARAAGAYVRAQLAERADHVIIGRVERLFGGRQLQQKPED